MFKHDDPFDTAFMRKLELLELVYRRLNSGSGAGEAVGRGRGGRTEFREHRRYAPGDDFRYIDWNVFGRTDALFVKEHAREERRTVSVLLDCSRSMGFGRPSKLVCGKQLAAAFAYLALVAGDEAVVVTFDEAVRKSVTVSGQKGRITEILRELRDVPPQGRTGLEDSLKEFHSNRGRRSMVVLISDLMGEDCRRSLAMLAAKGFEPCVIQLLSREETAPRQTGRLRLRDAETGRTRSLWIEGAELREYELILNEFIEGWRRFCASHRMAFVAACSDVSVDELVIGYLREGGLVR
ncbi:MAG: DUF58 domain-containing protein [Planctomycetes bacterium]|nr:DUF58 domain-containing protein [Planctomycetota bacterium]